MTPEAHQIAAVIAASVAASYPGQAIDPADWINDQHGGL